MFPGMPLPAAVGTPVQVLFIVSFRIVIGGLIYIGCIDNEPPGRLTSRNGRRLPPDVSLEPSPLPLAGPGCPGAGIYTDPGGPTGSANGSGAATSSAS